MATLVLIHAHYDRAHLDAVKSEMVRRGPPTLRAMEAAGVVYLLEGSHRARAAAELGLEINLEMIDYPEDDSIRLCDLVPGLDSDNEVREIVGRGAMSDEVINVDAA